jgi:hypothetical protein
MSDDGPNREVNSSSEIDRLRSSILNINLCVALHLRKRVDEIREIIAASLSGILETSGETLAALK